MTAWKISLLMVLIGTNLSTAEETNANGTMVQGGLNETEGPHMSCYNGMGIFKLKSECAPGTVACAYLKTPVSWTYICGGNETLEGCQNVTHLEFHVSDSGKFETCYCTTGDNCNPASGFGPNWLVTMALSGILMGSKLYSYLK